MRTIPILSAFAIMGVVLNHANWHILSGFVEGDSLATPFIIIDQIGKFAVSAYVFIAGYFASYATNSGKKPLVWKVVRGRVLNMVWPWLLWSVIMSIGHVFQGSTFTVNFFLANLFVQYYFIPLLISYNLASPLLIKWLNKNTRGFFTSVLLIAIISLGLFYLRVYLPTFPRILYPFIDLGPVEYLRYIVFFSFGLYYGMFPELVKKKIEPYKKNLPWALLTILSLSICETFYAYSFGGTAWPVGGDQTKISSMLFSLSILIWFISFERLSIPGQNILARVGNRSLGIYLSHYVILGLLGKLYIILFPGIVSCKSVYVIVLFMLTMLFAMVLMTIVAKLPIKTYYKYLFG